MTRKAVIFLAPGFEELEAVAPIDVFRRAGLAVSLCGVKADAQGLVAGAHGLKLQCDARISELDPLDFLLTYFPGGMPGATNLAGSPEVLSFAQAVNRNHGFNCAICAAPIALDAAGLLAGVDYTCYPGFESHIQNGHYTGKYIQKSGHILTACGPAAALDFAFEILRAIGLSAIVSSLADGMQVQH